MKTAEAHNAQFVGKYEKLSDGSISAPRPILRGDIIALLKSLSEEARRDIFHHFGAFMADGVPNG